MIPRASASLIIRTGGAGRPCRQDLYLKKTSSFQIGLGLPADGVHRQACPALAAVALDLEPDNTAVEALYYRWSRLGGPTVALHETDQASASALSFPITAFRAPWVRP